MHDRRVPIATVLLGAILFFLVGVWWDLHGLRDDFRRSLMMPDRLTTIVNGMPVHTERATGETDAQYVNRHIGRVQRAEEGE